MNSAVRGENSAVRFAVSVELRELLCDYLRFWGAPAYVVVVKWEARHGRGRVVFWEGYERDASKGEFTKGSCDVTS